MPTVPVFIRTTTDPSGYTYEGSPGWVVIATPYVPSSNSCRNLTDEWLQWTGSGTTDDPTGLPSPPTSLGSGSGIGLSSYTYDDGGDAINVAGKYFTGLATVTHSVNSFFMLTTFGGFLGGQANFDVTVETPIANDSEVSFTVTFRSTDYLWDSTLFYKGAEYAQLKVAGVTKNFTLTPTQISTGDTTESGMDGASHTLTQTVNEYTGAVTFELSENTIEIRFGNTYGEWLAWMPLHFKPQGSFNVTSNDELATFDAGGIYVVGGDIASGDGLSYTFSNGDIPQPFETDEAVATHDISDGGLSDGDTLEVQLIATSAQGCTNTFNDSATLANSAGIFGTLTDATGAVWSAVNDGDNIQVSRFKSGAASRELLATIANAKNASIYKDRRNSIRLAYQDRSDGLTKIVRSVDSGVTFA